MKKLKYLYSNKFFFPYNICNFKNESVIKNF